MASLDRRRLRCAAPALVAPLLAPAASLGRVGGAHPQVEIRDDDPGLAGAEGARASH